jgi:hypothetical protein
MDGDSTQDRFDHGETPSLVHEVGLPAGQSGSDLVHHLLHLGARRLADG